MLEIKITPNSLIFKNLSDDLLFEICKANKNVEFKTYEKRVFVKDTPHKLYMLLLDLSRDYDIELS